MQPIHHLERVMAVFHRQVGIALGSTQTQTCVLGSTQIDTQPTHYIVHPQARRVVMAGRDAAALRGKMIAPLHMIAPVSHGVVVDDVALESFLKMTLQRTLGRSYMLKPVVMISVPAHASPIERSGVRTAAFRAGAQEVYMVDEVLAAAIGIGIPVAESGGNIVVHIGAQHSEISVLSLGSSVYSKTLFWGGDTLDQVIQRFCAQQHGIEIDLSTATAIKLQLGVAMATGQKQIAIRGRTARSIPQEKQLDVQELLLVVTQEYNVLWHFIQEVLEELPVSVATDVIDTGFLLTGGGALSVHLDGWLTQQLGVSVAVAEHPELAVIHGIQKILQQLTHYKASLFFAQ